MHRFFLAGSVLAGKIIRWLTKKQALNLLHFPVLRKYPGKGFVRTKKSLIFSDEIDHCPTYALAELDIRKHF